MVYADHYQLTNSLRNPHPVIDFQQGSVRDDFDFGSVLLFKTQCLKQAFSILEKQPEYTYSALYALILTLFQRFTLTHIRGFLYTEIEEDTRKSGEKQFDYVNPNNRQIQMEREEAFTFHLKAIGAYLPPAQSEISLTEGHFAYEVSVIIPVRNRVQTVNSCIFIEQFGYEFGFTAYMLYLIQFSEGPHKTAHYAICTAFMALGMMIPGMAAGWIQTTLGYQHFFIWIVACTAVTFAVTALLRFTENKT